MTPKGVLESKKQKATRHGIVICNGHTHQRSHNQTSSPMANVRRLPSRAMTAKYTGMLRKHVIIIVDCSAWDGM